MAAVALEIEHGVDHVLDHLGAGDLPVLGDVAYEHERGALRLGVADERLRGRAHLAHRAGRGFEPVGPQRLDRIDDDEIGALALGERRQDVGEVGLAGERQRRRRQSEALGPQAHLRRGLLAREVDGAAAGIGEGGAQLQQQRRLADARLAADEKRGARHDAAAGDAVELGEPRRDARDPVRALGQRLERHGPALGGPRQPGARRRRHVGLLDERVPFPTRHAFSGPARGHGPAALADELTLGGFDHAD